MKINILVLLLSISSLSFGQQVIPFIDFNNFFKSYDGETFRFIEMQQIKEFKAGDEFVAYLDIRGNLRVYDGKERMDLTNMNIEYQVSDHYIGWNVGTTLNMWGDGKKETLTYFGADYVVKDSMIIFMDTRWNSLNVKWKDKIYPIQTVTGTLTLQNSGKIGENVMAFADNGNLYRIFYNGNSYELGVWNGDINFQSGTDIVAFNDPTTRTFAVFDAGTFMDVEMQWVSKYKAGRGFVAYEDVNGNLMVYKNGVKTQLSSFPGKWDVKDDVILYMDNGFTYIYSDGVKVQAANYQIEDYKLKNATCVFKTIQGGISAVVDGKLYEITNLLNSEFEIYGNNVIVSTFNSSYIILCNGKIVRS